MKREVSPLVVVVVLVALGIVIAILGYYILGSPKRNVSPEEQEQMFSHMKPLPPTFHF